jgi:arylsulfatase
MPATNRDGDRLNILFIFTDQERHMSGWPPGMSLPAHERLKQGGVTFTNHYTSAMMCTPSRSVMFTGLQTADNGMFDNCDCPWQESLSPKVPSVGHMLRKAGYYTAYKGKWHLNRKFDSEEPTELYTKEMDDYGFADYASPGDIVGHDLGGYSFDHLIAGSAITWLRRKGRPLTDAGKPWSLFVSLVNPHDIMYFNTDAPGQPVQDTGALLKRATPAPNHPLYRKTWDVPVAPSLLEPLDAAGRPKAHGEFLRMWDYVLGHIPLEEERWRRFNDFYFNSIRSVDMQLQNILDELDALGLSENTILGFTADHGEMAGAHGLRGKGPFAYEEAIHVPFVVVHPDVAGGQTCTALSSHIDLAPTLLALAGASQEQRGEFAGRDLPGKDLSGALSKGSKAGLHEARDSVLFAFSALCTNDSTLLKVAGEAIAANRSPKAELEKAGYKPDMTKRGSVRTVYDGRYKFSRYFGPVARNLPNTLEDLYANNDVELFDLSSDPAETVNLAADRAKNAGQVAAMSAKLEQAIRVEIGRDDGREMPDIPNVSWYMETADL